MSATEPGRQARWERKGRYDLILDDGEYRVNMQLNPASDTIACDERRIRHALRIRGWYALPWLGKLWRNSWAKRKGALLSRPITVSLPTRAGR